VVEGTGDVYFYGIGDYLREVLRVIGFAAICVIVLLDLFLVVKWDI